MAKPPEIANSTAREREQYIYDNFYCRADCDNCGLCAIYKGKPLEVVYAEYIEGTKSFQEISQQYRGR